MPKSKTHRAATSLRTPATRRPREQKSGGYPDLDSPDSPAGRVEFGFAFQTNSAVYQYGQARAEAGLGDAKLIKQNDSQSWKNYFSADLSSRKANVKHEPTVKREPQSRIPAAQQVFNPFAKSASQSSSFTTAVPGHPTRQTTAASNSASSLAASTRTTAIRKDKRKADAMTEALEEVLAESPCKKHSKTSDPRQHDAENDVFMCSCTDQAHIID